MKKYSCKLLCTMLALVMVVSLLPITAAAASSKEDAYTAYTEFLYARMADIGKPVWDEDFYNFVNTNKRDAKLDEISGVAFAELTNDGVKEMIVKYHVEYNFTMWSVPDGKFWTCIYTYKNGEVTLIGQSPLWMIQKEPGSWVTVEPPGYVMSGDWYLCTGNDGRNHICHLDPTYITSLTWFFGYNGQEMAKEDNFNYVFVPDWEIEWAGGEIESQYGKAYYYVNNQKVDKATHDAALAKYTGGGIQKITYTDAESAVENLQFELQNPFGDVAAADYFSKPVLWAVEKGITGGIGERLFGPNNGCTRGQVVTFLWAAAGRPEPTSTENPFNDVSESDFFYKPVLWAVEKGITGGIGEGLFGPNNTCTRGQIMTFLWSAKGKPEPASKTNSFADVKKSDYYYTPVLWAANQGVTGGVAPGYFGPENTCTRAQVVTFLYKAFDGESETPAPIVTPTPTPAPTPTPKPVQETLVTEMQDYSAVSVLPENAVQDIVYYTNHSVKADYSTSNRYNFTAYDEASLEAYMTMLKNNGFTLVDTYASSSARSWGFVYDLNPDLETVKQLYTYTNCHLYIKIDSNDEAGMTWSEDLNMCDLGMRIDSSTVSVGAKGPSVEAGLWKMSDGSFQTSDGRLSVAPGEAMVIRDGQTLRGKAAMSNSSSGYHKYSVINITDYCGEESLTYSAEVGESKLNAVYRIYDMENRNTRYVCLTGDDTTLTTAFPNQSFDSVTVRPMYITDSVVVIYIYAEAHGAEPETIEILAAAKR